MNHERWEQVKTVLGEALEYEDCSEREIFLKRSCENDTGLRREVESLLSRPIERWEEAAEEARALRADGAGETGQRIGAYIILRELGRGGMGAVYLARRDDQHFKKEVAVKLLKRGTDTDEVLRRFRGERDILARLEHPNIARLIDGGTTNEGLPYFIMEYVKGIPLNEFCAANSLTIEEKLRLFLKICGAVRFAHQNLVVHRDLKPANILVDESGEPKLLDFGIAKLLAPGEHTFDLTMLDQQRLTPAYASPEQVLGEPITTVSDIYSLGALLYEVLSGQGAHRFSKSHPASTELRRVITEQEVTRPSLTVTDVWMRRRLRGDLDNIILKALRKDPARRYGGVGGFAEDIRRYLEDRPVRARPDTVWYRTTKLVKRNKIAVVAATVVAGTLVAGAIVTTQKAREARRASARAERRFNDLRAVANSFMLELNNAIKDLPGSLRARQMLTSRALGYLDSLAVEAGGDLSLQKELATAYQKLGLVTFDVEQALATHRKAASLSERLVRAQPDQAEYRSGLAENYANLSDVLKIAGRSAEAIEYARKAISHCETVRATNPSLKTKLQLASAYETLDAALSDAGFVREAAKAAEMSVRIHEEVVATDSKNAEYKRDLAEAYGQLSEDLIDVGENARASAMAGKAMEITAVFLKNEPTSARNRRNMWAAKVREARKLWSAGDLDQAEDSFAKALQLIQELSSADPSDRGHRYWTAATLLEFGNFQIHRSRTRQAVEFLVRAITIDDALAAEDHQRMEVQRDLVRLYGSLGQACIRLGDKARALQVLQKGQALGQTLAAKDSNNLLVMACLAHVEMSLGDLHAGSPADAREHYQNAAALWRTIKQHGELRPQDEMSLRSVEALLRTA